MFKFPKAKKENIEEKHFGIRIKDPYRWMENEEDDDLKAWLEAQNELTQSYFNEIPERDIIKKRLRQLYDYPKYSTITVVGKKIIYSYNDGLKNQPVYYMQEGLEGEPVVLLDPNQLSDDGTVSVFLNGHSKNNRYLAYLQSQSGSDWHCLKIMDLEKKEALTDQLEWIKFTWAAWYKDGFFYSGYEKPMDGKEFSQQNKEMKVFYHKLGEDQGQDQLIYSDAEHPLRFIGVMVSEDEDYLILVISEGTYGSEFRVKRIDDKNAPFQTVFEGFDNEHFYIGSSGDDLFFLTDKDAPNKKVVKVNATNLEIVDYIAQNEQVLENAWKFGEHIVTLYLQDVISKLYLYDMKGQLKKEVQMPGIGSVIEVAGDKEWDQILFSFTSFNSPLGLHAADVVTGETKAFKESNLSFDTSELITEQVFYKSKDGTKIPMFITRKRDLKLDGKNPTLLYAYGGFNISLTPSFNPSIIYLLENGGIYAHANLRGGGEYGEKWHKAGMHYNKQNVFDDFIAAAEYLIDNQYTAKEYLAIHGRSNGGLLMGAVTNQRPDLFSVVFAQVGVMDMLRFHKFTIGWGWAAEYGNPEEEAFFKYILTYSPLHNIEEKDYPAVMVITGDHDDRVVPAHSFKYLATLQEKNTSDQPILLRLDRKAGHGMGKPVEKIIEEYTDMYTFLFHCIRK
ncbi:MAG: prolyl oligopeptidase family serine peptidase [Thermotogota bacterium]